MITQLFGAFAPRKHNDINATLNPNSSTRGKPVARFGQWKFCWEAKGSPRDKFMQEIRPQITRLLNGYFGSVPGPDQFTLSLYVVGRSENTAIPTIMIISRNEQSRRGARKAINESKVLAQYPEFRTQYVNKDPGSVNIMPLASGTSSGPTILTTEDATEILYDTSRPITPMGVPIYIRTTSSLRPATANLVRLGDRLFFQTVHHAFRADPIGFDMTSITTDEDLVIDSDSETENDYYNEAQLEVTSAGSRSPDTLSCLDSQYSGRSRRSSFTPCTSTLTSPTRGPIPSQDRVKGKNALDDAATQFNNATRRMNDVIANLANFAPTERTFAPSQPAQPTPESLSLLGRLVEESIEYDLALIEITNQKLEEILKFLLKHGKINTVAYDSIASTPEEDAKVYTYTASGGKLYGVLSANPSYTRLSTSTSFQKVYIVRLDGPLANGDCGSAIIDASTSETYGHLVAGCVKTGTAYILAADQIAEDVANVKPSDLNEEGSLKNIACVLPSPSLNSYQQLPPQSTLRGIRRRRATVACRRRNHRNLSSPSTLSEPQRNLIMTAISLDSENDQQYVRHQNHLNKPDKAFGFEHTGNALFPAQEYTDHQFISTFEGLPSQGVKRDFLECFAQHSIGSIPSLDAERILQFCKHDQPAAASKVQPVIRLYDLEYQTNKSRKYPERLSPEQLHQALSADRFEHNDLSDANRRQILIKNLDARCVQVLAETAAWHQVEPLRDVMSKHISRETSFRVQKQMYGADMPFLELHLPYLALRKAPGKEPARFHYSHEHNGKSHTSFCVPKFATTSGGEQEDGYVIHEAHISILLCIWDHSKWVAYMLSRPCPGSTSDEQDDDEEDTDASEDEDITAPLEDIFAPDNGLHNLSVADHPIWDPRKYYVRITALWVDVLRREYTHLVETLDMSVKAWRIDIRDTASEALCAGKQDSFATKSLTSTVETMQLLREVREHIVLAIGAWDSFVDTGKEFFIDLEDHDVQVALDNMKSSFGQLNNLKQKLVFLEDYFADSAKMLKLRLTLEGNETNRHAHDLNMHTNSRSREIHELNRRSTDAAIANVKAAKEMGRTAQTSVMLIWITTPLILGLQYFGADRQIFSFERNGRTFILAVCIVFLALPVLTFALYFLERIQKAIFAMFGAKEKRDDTEGCSDALELQQRYGVSEGV